MKFVILSPRQHHGGPIVLHALCKYLAEEGHDSKIFYTDRFSYCKENTDSKLYNKSKTLYRILLPVKYWLSYSKAFLIDMVKFAIAKCFPNIVIKKNRYNGYVNETVKNCKRKYLPFVDRDTIVIYPEIVYGNPLHAQKVVRWFLYHYKYENDTKAYGSKDLFFCFRDVFNNTKLNPNAYKLYTPFFDLNFYKQYNFGERKGKCYIIRKGKDRDDIPKNFDGVIIDNLPEKEKIKVFNECEYCISYDTQTAYNRISALCGCTSIIVPEVGKTGKDYEINPVGIAIGFEESEIEHAINTREQIFDMYTQINLSGKKSTQQFVGICNQYFSN